MLGTDLIIGKSVKKISGFDNLARQIIRRLSTPRGSLFYDPDYGMDIKLFLNTNLNPSKLMKLEMDIKNECESDPRVDEAEVSIKYNPSTLSLEIEISLVTIDGSFTLILNVSSLNIELLNINGS